MPIVECCKVDVICCEADASITDVAMLMRKHHVGDVIVTEKKRGKQMPIGIVTDRDIVIETISLQLDVNVFTAGDIMTPSLVTVREDKGFVETLRLMREHKIRRLPVVTQTGALYGIVTADDIVNLLAKELLMVTETITDQPLKEEQSRHAHAVH